MSATVTDVTEIMGDAGDVQADGSVKFVRKFRVKLSAPSNVGQDLALFASHGSVTIPAYGALWPRSVTGRPRPTVKTIQARPLDPNSRLLYVVTVNYDNEATGSSSERDTAPWLRAKQYSYDFADTQVALQEDYSSTPKLVVNVNDEPFDPVPTVTRSFRRITITRASQSFSEAVASALTNTINSAAFSIRGESYAARRLRLVRWGATTDVWLNESGAELVFYNETIEIEVGDITYGHDLRILNQGYREKVGTEIVRAVDSDGNPLPEPVLLAADGKRLAPSAQPHFLTFRAYRSLSWSALGTL